MTPTLLIALVVVAVLAAGAFALTRRRERQSHDGALMDLGVVSARWIAEVRRDEPWTRT